MEKSVSNINIDEKLSLFNKTIFNVLSNYIPHEAKISDDKDPPWFNSRTESLIENKNKLRKDYQRFKWNGHLLSKLNLLQEQLHLSKNKSKQYITQEWRDRLASINPFFKQQKNTSNSTTIGP